MKPPSGVLEVTPDPPITTIGRMDSASQDSDHPSPSNSVRAGAGDILVDAPSQPSSIDTPENLSATIDVPPRPEPTLTIGGEHSVGDPPSAETLRLSVPGYEILKELGRGGMGVVYLARQVGLNRAVALKMILSGEHAGVSERDRFRREAEAVAALQHPNIVQIFDVGEADGRPYLAFEYVGGGSLAALLDGQPWPAKPAADLIEAVARATQFAHGRGIVHRDLKPANILLQNAEPGLPQRKAEDPLFRIPSSALRVPKITDFGLAKRVEPDSSWSDDSGRTAPMAHTRTGAVVGTPSYLAPEQAAGKNRTVGPAADIYALGAILYELLAGRPPFRGETPLETVLQVMADEPVPPSKLRAKLPRDLETICLKCLEKDARKRYSSAEALADDLRRFQRGEPIAARPVGRYGRAVKWMNRHPAATLLTATSGLAVVALLGVSLYFNVRLRIAADQIEDEAKAARDAEMRALGEKGKADEERIEADKQRIEAEKARLKADVARREAERGVYALQLFKAAALGERDPQRALRLLDDRNRCPEELRDFTWRLVRSQFLVTEQVIGVHQAANGIPPAARVTYSPDGKLAATVSGLDPLVRVYDVEGRRLAFVLAGHQLAAHGVAFAPDGRTIATAGGDNTVRIWELPAGKPPARPVQIAPMSTLTGHLNTVYAVVFSIDGHRLASAGADGSVRVWDVPPRVEGKQRVKPSAAIVLKEHTGTVWALAWSESGLFSAGSDGRVLIWRLSPGGGSAVELFKLKKQALALAVSPDGELLAAAGNADEEEDEPIIQLFRPLIDRKAGTLRGHTGIAIYDLSFAPDGKRLVSGGRDGTIRIWDVAALQERAVFRPEKDPRPPADAVRQIRGVAFGPDGLSVASGGQDGALRVWGFAGQKEEVAELDVRSPLASAATSADGCVLAVAEKNQKRIKVWRLGDPAEEIESEPSLVLEGLDQPAQTVAVNENGTAIVAATDGGVYAWQLAGSGTASPRPVRVSKAVAASLALRGDELAMATNDAQLLWVNIRTGKLGFSFNQVSGRPSLVAFSSDGRKLISAGSQTLQVWDALTGELLFGQVLAHIRRITAIAVRPGDTRGEWDMATADEGGYVKVWDLKPRPPAEDGRDHPSGQALVVSERPAPLGLSDSVQWLAFTTDGRTLATGGADRVVRLRDPETGQERAALAGHTDTVLLVAFRADQVLLTVGREGFVRVWRAGK